MRFVQYIGTFGVIVNDKPGFAANQLCNAHAISAPCLKFILPTGRLNSPCQDFHALDTAPVPGYKSTSSSSGRAPTISKAQWHTFSGFAPVNPLRSVILS